MKSIKNIGFICFKDSLEVREITHEILLWSKNNKNKNIFFLDNQIQKDVVKDCCLSENDFKNKCELVVSLGGDGTFLSMARFCMGISALLLGINLGKVGFLANVPFSRVDKMLETVSTGIYDIVETSVMRVNVFDGNSNKVFSEPFFNDAVFHSEQHHLIDLEVTINNEYLTNYWSDGLIISTAIGSTGYSLSAGGPILYPQSDLCVLTPMNPTSLSVRPLVLPSKFSLSLSTKKNEEPLSTTLIVDGKENFPLGISNRVEIRQEKHKLKLLKPEGASFFKSIREKLGWSGQRVI